LNTETSGLRFENIDKRYGGIYALRRVTLEIGAGECVALAGRNGSGKTTLLRVAAGIVRPTAGKLTLPATRAAGGNSGEHSSEQTFRPGYVAHAAMVYDELTALENLVLFARLQDVERPADRAEELLRDVGLIERRDSLVRTFSRGMRQRMAIARALIHRPSVLLFDEPATGLDPVGIAWLVSTLARMKNDGCTILMSLHGESEISAIATRAVRLEAGSVAGDSLAGDALTSIFRFGSG
jgi:heme exporter protein A